MEIANILEKVAQIRRDVVSKETERVDHDFVWPKDGLRALQQAGLGGLVIDEKYGGLGGGLYALTVVCEALGETCASTALCFGMHCVGSAIVGVKATAEQRTRFLDPIVRGEHLTTLALSEPGSGVHLYFPNTKLERAEDGGYVVTGRKSFVTSGGYADSYVISTAALDETMDPDECSCLIVERDVPGLKLGPEWKGMGMRGNSSREVEFVQARVPKYSLLGEEGDQMFYVFNVGAPYFLMAMAGTYLGVANAALREAIKHLSTRKYTHNASSPTRSPVIQHKLGSLFAEVERTKRLCYHAAISRDEGSKEAGLAMFAAKAEAGDCVVHVTNEVMTLLGGIGYRESGRAERLLRDARAAHIMSPSTDLLKLWTGRVLLRQPLLGD